MKSFSTIEDALYSWAAGILGVNVPVIWYHLNAPRPLVPYVALHLFTSRSVGVDAQLPPNHAGAIEIIGNRDFTLECQGIGSHSNDFLELLKTSLERPTVQSSLRAAGIVIVDRLPINDISELVDNRWEERNVMDLIFRFAQTDTDVPGVIEIVNAEKDFYNPSLHTITVEHITIP
jgi:hypothetical protein